MDTVYYTKKRFNLDFKTGLNISNFTWIFSDQTRHRNRNCQGHYHSFLNNSRSRNKSTKRKNMKI